MTRTFRAFMEKEDLQDVFTRFQSLLPVYYTPTYSDSGPVTWEDITVLPGLGVNTRGEHIGNCQLRIFPRQTSCTWRSYQCLSPDNTHTITRHTTLCDENTSAVDIDLGGLYQGEVLFPTTTGTIRYENEESKKLFNALKKCFRRVATTTVNGYFIGPRTYKNRKTYRFCTISIHCPPRDARLIP